MVLLCVKATALTTFVLPRACVCVCPVHAANIPTTMPKWAADSSTDNCTACGKAFSMFRRRQYVACVANTVVACVALTCALRVMFLRSHCRNCGDLFCYQCAEHYVAVPALGGEVARVCDTCNHLLLQAVADQDRQRQPAAGRTRDLRDTY